MNASLFPLFADLRDRPVLVVGSGVAAERKVQALLQAGALPVVGAPELSDRQQEWLEQGRLRWRAGEFRAEWLDEVWLVVAATNAPATNRAVAAAAAARRLLTDVVDDAQTASSLLPAPGSVVLVGAGPGDPGLLTLHALRALNEADVILHDRLVSNDVLQLARRDAVRIEVGKSSGRHSTPQDEIHALMLQHARAGQRVVRLKGGDPFVFGRGGEELQFLQQHGIAFEVVPGITAAVACAAYAGIPLTHRDHAQSLRLVTAHCKDSFDTLDWAALAQPRQTLAIYMGVAALETLRDKLLAAGLSPQTPFAVIENGSRAQQRVVAGTLDELPDAAQHHQVQSPALLVVGEVAALADTLHWFGAPPLRLPHSDNLPAAMLARAA